MGIVGSHLSVNSGENPWIKGVWLTNIDSEILFDVQSLKTAIQTLKQTGFNTIYPTVWQGGYTLYPSAVLQAAISQAQDPLPALRDRHLLQESQQLGQQQKMRVIPWVEFGFMAPADSRLARKYPQWLTRQQDGNPIWLEGKTLERVWLNPLHPEVQQFFTKLMLELVSQTDVIGLQFDDHFGYPANLGYDDFTVQLYQQEHQGQLPPPPIALDPQNNCVSADPQWQAWVNWRSQKISKYLADLTGQLKAQKPDLIISISPNPQTFSKNCFLADWQSWEQQDLINELVLQVYRSNLAQFIQELSQPEVKTAKQHISVIVGILAGLKGRPAPLSQLQEQITWVKDKQFAGVSFFFYESLWNFGSESPPQRQHFLQQTLNSPIR